VVIISGSGWRKTLVTAVAVGGFVSLYETTTLDSKYAARQATMREPTALPAPGSRLAYSATAYCKGITTASGVPVQTGILAADPELLPVGSIVDLNGLPDKFNGIYTVLDTVLRLGWNPRATTPSFLDRFFKKPEAPPLFSRPLPLASSGS
jgi:3D (Asp-Asp-Asp) domain-containing protein